MEPVPFDSSLPVDSPGSELPRVLILSYEEPETSTAGGILLYRLFSGYPAERVFVIGRELDPEINRLPFRHEVLQTPWLRFERSRFHRLKRSLRALNIAPVASPESVDRLLNGFRPEVVVCVMQFSRYYDCAHRFAQERRLPLVAIIHDVNEEFERVLPCAVAANRRRDGEFYRFAGRRLCVSPEMEQLCADLYGVRGTVQYPNRSEDLIPRAAEQSLQLKRIGELTLGFVGNLNYGYGAELVQMLPIFRQTHTRLIVYSRPPGPEAIALRIATDCCELRGFVPAMEAWTAVQRDCDAVLLAYPNPAGVMERLYRHHFPSKLPEYLALGMPVVITGPEYATGVKWGLAHPDAAVTVTSLAAFKPLLARLQVDAAFRLALAREASAAGMAHFDPARIREAFLRHLREAATGNV